MKMTNSKVNGRIYKWLKAYLDDKRARIQIDGNKAKQVLLLDGVPHCGVMSPSVFLI